LDENGKAAIGEHLSAENWSRIGKGDEKIRENLSSIFSKIIKIGGEK